ncbi:MAG: FAD:protein FMN transferase [Kofleriaceae bacterium]
MFTFPAMNTEVTVTASGDEQACATRVAQTFAEAEQRFSRFREDSELSALNRAQGPFVASPPLFELLARARRYVELTDGLFDPAIGATLAALGYDRSFAPRALDRACAAPLPAGARFLDVVLDEPTRTVLRPRQVHLDLGGIAKGATVDRAAVHLVSSGAIDAGGDAVLRGAAPDGGEWLVEIEDPRDPSRTLATVAASNAAVATSAPNRRRWRLGASVAHHLIDPRTGRPSTSDLLQATVVAPSAELADVLAKTAYLLGARDGRRFLERRPGIGGVLVRASGEPLLVGVLDVREVAHA